MLTFDYTVPQPIIELYECIQGEGKYVGTPSILLRITGCKLRCFFGGDFCDTFYASWEVEKDRKRYNLGEVRDFLVKSKLKHLIISGGSPTLYPDLLQHLVWMGESNSKFITIESEGSKFVDVNCDFLSLSPKLSNSIPPATPAFGDARKIHLANYANYEIMKQQIQYSNDYQVKFVISDKSDVEEAKEVIKKLNVPNNKVYLMPEGLYDDKIKQTAIWLIPLCIENNFNFSDRLHIRIFGNIRFV